MSVIIPVYQGATYVLAAVKSALQQTYAHLDVIVVDDGSTDGTWQRLQTITDKRVRLFHQDNSGASSARNLGLSYAKGEYIAFLDADDLWLPEKLSSELAIIRYKQDPVAIVYSWYYCVNDDGMLSRPSPPVTHTGYVINSLLTSSLFIIPSASLFHRDIFSTVGTFDTTRRYHEDFAFILRACQRHPAYPSKRYNVLYKQSMNGKARSIMRDYNTAVHASLSIVSDVSDILSKEQTEALYRLLQRELYFRFLMYGFNTSAALLLQDIPTSSLPGGAKGWLGWFFAKTRINLMQPTRKIVQLAFRTLGRRRWRRQLKLLGVDHGYFKQHARPYNVL